ncbi:MAG TPA: penicillin-binding protein 2 [Rhodocyclaceae bacterium]|nr:penicillin-binding protein 2 [Rhodocyclaceae bacterium]
MEFKHPEEEIERFRKRLGFASGFVLFCFAVLILRFVWLQIIQHRYYQTRAEENRIALVPITPNRGLIVDRNGAVLARNYSAYTLELTTSKVNGKLDDVIDQLAKIVDIQPRDRKRFKKLLEENKNFESLPIRTRLTDEEVARFIANRYRFPGVDIKARLFRQYPEGSFASHLLGYIGRINDADIGRIDDADQTLNYRGTDYIGKAGLEQHYEFQLHGTSGVEQIEVDAGGHAVRTLARTAPIAGDNLMLTVDAKLQKIAENAFGDRRGALVAIDPTTGGILALVSMPNYDPNLFVDGIDGQSWKDLNESEDKPMINRAINGAYPPGSTFKPYMALAALTTGKRRPDQAISDPGYFNFGGHQFRDDTKGGHGIVDMYKSIVVSCDTYYYMLANDLGIDAIAKFMAQFGFGSKTGVDIDGESKGVLPSPQWKMERFKKPEQQKWYAGETISIGIGQGYNSYTPIQLAQAMATLANDGVMYRPHLVKYVTDTRTGKQQVVEPQPIRTIPLKQEDIDVIKRAMVGVNTEGTGARAFANAGYTSGGKTGTAQVFSLKGSQYKGHAIKEHLRDHALFIAFAPADHPKIAVAVLVENGGWGAEAAAPIARQVFDYYLLGKVPNAPATPDAGAKDDDTPDEATTPEDDQQ